ncbi:retrovirus-related pol polyprotein from transposon TNT 1-94 [Tanacetum coccineum]
MADLNIPANDAPVEQAPAVAPPTRTDDQILPLSKWVPIGKSNCVLDVHKPQRNPIFPIVVALLKNTNFFRAFTASSTIPAIYIQQFWDTMCFNTSTGLYSCQLDEQWFNLHKDLLRDALDITPTNDNNPFVASPSSDTVIEYVNTLGYPSMLKNVSAMPRHPVLQILWGIIHRSNIDYAESIWEEFVQSIQTFLIDSKNLATAARGKKKTAHLLILSVRFTKLIIHHLRTKHNIHPRTSLPLHYSHEESILNTLRFIGKDGRAIFGMPIPDALLTDEIKGAPYYGDYQEHVANKKIKGWTSGKRRKPKSPLKLVDQPSDEGVPVEELTHTDEESDLQRALELSLKEQAERTQGPARPVVLREPDSGKYQPLPETPTKKILIDQFIFQRRPPMHTKPIGHADSPSLDAELPLTESETESDEEVLVINAGDQDEGQAGPNPVELDEGQAGPNPGIQDEGHAGSNPGDAENLKLPTEDQVILEEPASSTGTLSSLQNLEKDLNFTNQFFVEKPHEEESGKTNAETEVQSMVSVPIHQDTSSIPPMTTPVIDLMTMQSDLHYQHQQQQPQ